MLPSLLWIDDVVFPPGWVAERHAHDNCDEMLLVMEGVLAGDAPALARPLGRGNLVIHARGMPHQEWTGTPTSLRLFSVGFRRPPGTPVLPVRVADAEGRIECGLRWVAEGHGSGPRDRAAVAALLHAVLRECHRAAAEPEADGGVAAALEFIRVHACRGLSVQDVADHVGVGRRTLERRFSGLLGRSPGEEILRWRLRHAQQLLTRTNEKISRIACRCGFSDAKAFRASFRAAYGCLPAAYRNDVRPTLTHAAPSLTQTPP